MRMRACSCIYVCKFVITLFFSPGWYVVLPCMYVYTYIHATLVHTFTQIHIYTHIHMTYT